MKLTAKELAGLRIVRDGRKISTMHAKTRHALERKGFIESTSLGWRLTTEGAQALVGVPDVFAELFARPERVELRATFDEVAQWRNAAANGERSLSSWIRWVCNRASEPVVTRKTQKRHA